MLGVWERHRPLKTTRALVLFVCHSLGGVWPLLHFCFGSYPWWLVGKITLIVLQEFHKEWVLICANPKQGEEGWALVPPGASGCPGSSLVSDTLIRRPAYARLPALEVWKTDQKARDLGRAAREEPH